MAMDIYSASNDSPIKIGFFGLNNFTLALAVETARNYKVRICTHNISSKYHFPVKDFQPLGVELLKEPKQLADIDIYFLDSASESVYDWESIKNTTSQIAQNLKKGNWIIIGPGIDSDMVEAILIDIIEAESKMRVSVDFDIAFARHQDQETEMHFLSEGLKISHQSIIKKVQTIFALKPNAANTIFHSIEFPQVSEAEKRIRDLWVPMLNQMPPSLFNEFLSKVFRQDFLSSYQHLQDAETGKVNVPWFLNLALKHGLEHHVSEQDIQDDQQAS